VQPISARIFGAHVCQSGCRYRAFSPRGPLPTSEALDLIREYCARTPTGNRHPSWMLIQRVCARLLRDFRSTVLAASSSWRRYSRDDGRASRSLLTIVALNYSRYGSSVRQLSCQTEGFLRSPLASGGIFCAVRLFAFGKFLNRSESVVPLCGTHATPYPCNPLHKRRFHYQPPDRWLELRGPQSAARSIASGRLATSGFSYVEANSAENYCVDETFTDSTA
jgi:hypothetical protein